VNCYDLDALIEAIADGSHTPNAEEAAHLASCAVCQVRLERARGIEQLLATREIVAPSASFTVSVMTRIGQERWKAERAIDLGFNVAIAAGVLLILVGGIGLAWSLGFLTISIDVDALWQTVGSQVAGRFLSQVQTVAMAAVLLTMALALWWWAEGNAAL
jgi:hypothetical protein